MSLRDQTVPPESILLVLPPQSPPELATNLASIELPLEAASRIVTYPALASALLENRSDAAAFFHAGSIASPYRLEHDESNLRTSSVAGILSLPIVVSGPGTYAEVPRVSSLTQAFVGGSPAVLGEKILEIPGGLESSEWVMDCLTLRAAPLRRELHGTDVSIIPGLHRLLNASGEVLVSDRCLTTCVSTSGSKSSPRQGEGLHT